MEHGLLTAWLAGVGVIFLFLGIDCLKSRDESFVTSVVNTAANKSQGMTWKRIANSLGPVIAGFFPVVSMDKLRQKIIWAGTPFDITGEEFMGLKVICLGIGVIIGVFLTAIGFPPIILLIISILAYILPDAYLSSVLKKRQKSIYKDMPVMAGLLATAIKAGVELGPALESIGKNLTGPLGDEMKRTWREIATGKPRSSCLRNMAKRTGVPIVERFVETINTAEERGSEKISQTLNNFMNDLQSSQSRKAQEEARKLPTKMLLPLVACIFLPMLAILMTPVVFMLAKAF